MAAHHVDEPVLQTRVIGDGGAIQLWSSEPTTAGSSGAARGNSLNPEHSSGGRPRVIVGTATGVTRLRPRCGGIFAQHKTLASGPFTENRNSQAELECIAGGHKDQAAATTIARAIQPALTLGPEPTLAHTGVRTQARTPADTQAAQGGPLHHQRPQGVWISKGMESGKILLLARTQSYGKRAVTRRPTG